MLALVVDRTAPSGVRLATDWPVPQPGPGEVELRVLRAGVCSTDLEIAAGYMQFGGVLGHEFVGRVEGGAVELLRQSGRGTNAKLGQRVVAEINCVGLDPPLDADARKHAWPRTVVGILGRDGAFAERLCVPAVNCHFVPDDVSDAEAVFAEPLAAALQVTRDHPPRAGRRVALLGPGRLGILCAQVLALETKELDVLGRSPRSLELCRTLGLCAMPLDEAPRRSYDLVVECSGAPDGLRAALRIVRPRGTVVLKSTYAGAADVDLAPVVIDEITVAGSRCGPMDAAVELLRQRRVRVRELIDAEFPLDQGVQAFERARRPGALKVQLVM